MEIPPGVIAAALVALLIFLDAFTRSLGEKRKPDKTISKDGHEYTLKK